MAIDKSQPDNQNDLSALERRLGAWRPASDGLDRDRMLFEVGRAAARANDRSRFWQFATAAMVLVTAGMGGLLVHERSQRLVREAQLAARSDPPELKTFTPMLMQIARIEPPGPNSYLALTLQLAKGVRDPSLPDAEFEPRPTQPAGASPESPPFSDPLRPRDLQRVLDL